MKNNYISRAIFLFSFLVAITVHAQVPVAKQWQVTFNNTIQNGSGNSQDWIFDAKHTADGGYIGAGFAQIATTPSTCNSSGLTSNSSLIKLNAEGQMEWKHTYSGGFPYGYGTFSGVIQLANGGYAAIGNQRFNDPQGIYANVCPDKTFFVITDKDGNSIVEKLIGFNSESVTTPDEYISFGSGLAEIPNSIGGGFIIAGSITSQLPPNITSDLYLIKLDASGNIDLAWVPKKFDSGYNDGAGTTCIKLTYSGGVSPDGTPIGVPDGFVVTGSKGKPTLPPYNSGLAKVAVQCFVGQFCGYINFSASYESLC